MNGSAALLVGLGLTSLWTGAWVSTSALAMLRAARTSKRGERPSARPWRVHLIRPCAGVDPALRSNLESLRRAHWPEGVELEVTFSTGRAEDAAAPICDAVAEQLRAEGWRVHSLHGPLPRDLFNQKVGQLARADASRESEIVINVDSDVDLSGFDFERLLAPFATSNTGAVWAAPIEVAPQSPADFASAALLGASLHSFALLAGLDPAGFVGKCFAIRREALDDAGGFASFGDWLGEDMELGRRLVASGWVPRFAGLSVKSMAGGRDMAQVRDRYRRWFSVIRWQRPALLVGYPMLFFAALPLMLAWMVLGVVGTPWLGLGAAFVASWRIVIARRAARASRIAKPTLGPGGWLLPALRADLLIARAFFACLRGDRVAWRGRELQLRRGGRLALR